MNFTQNAEEDLVQEDLDQEQRQLQRQLGWGLAEASRDHPGGRGGQGQGGAGRRSVLISFPSLRIRSIVIKVMHAVMPYCRLFLFRVHSRYWGSITSFYRTMQRILNRVLRRHLLFRNTDFINCFSTCFLLLEAWNQILMHFRLDTYWSRQWLHFSKIYTRRNARIQRTQLPYRRKHRVFYRQNWDFKWKTNTQNKENNGAREKYSSQNYFKMLL